MSAYTTIVGEGQPNFRTILKLPPAIKALIKEKSQTDQTNGMLLFIFPLNFTLFVLTVRALNEICSLIVRLHEGISMQATSGDWSLE